MGFNEKGEIFIQYREGPQPEDEEGIREAGRLVFGSGRAGFVEGIVSQIATAADMVPSKERVANFLATAVAGIQPRVEVEGMLAAQMAITHNLYMTLARRLAKAETLDQQNSAARAYNALCRTYAAQTEALKRYRTGGEQRVTVQHVNVGEGGRAIVGNVTGKGAAN